jgi:membrane protein DedA with SNARE-associated domain
MDYLLHLISDYGYFGLYSLLMLGIFGIPLPDETLLAFSGYLVSQGSLTFIPALVAAFTGSLTGITLNYLVGRTVGAQLLRFFGGYLHLTPEKLAKAQDWFARSGKWGLFFGYFFPGLRHLGPLVAGATRVPPLTFALFAYSGGFLWSLTYLSLGYHLGREWHQVSPNFQSVLWITLLGLCLIFLGVLFWQVRCWRQVRVTASSKK